MLQKRRHQLRLFLKAVRKKNREISHHLKTPDRETGSE
jgi:uncharacterized membrane protein